MPANSITIVDYDSGNVYGVSRALEHLGYNVELTGDPDRIANAARLILPGVGAFDAAWNLLQERNLVKPIQDFVASGRPFLGICVGMQLMLEEGTEFGNHQGFGFIAGRVERINDAGADGTPHPVPCVGWYALHSATDIRDSLMQNFDDYDTVYFVHSYAARPTNDNDVLAYSEYNGNRIVAAVRRGNVYGVQFHPERSGASGMKVLNNFMSAT